MGKYRLYLCTIDEEESEPLPGEQLPSRKSRRGFGPRRRLPLLATFSCLGVIPPVASEKKQWAAFCAAIIVGLRVGIPQYLLYIAPFRDTSIVVTQFGFVPPTGVAFAVLDDVVCFGFFLQIGYHRWLFFSWPLNTATLWLSHKRKHFQPTFLSTVLHKKEEEGLPLQVLFSF